MDHASHKTCVPRLRRIEGQIRGIIRMIDEERYCIDILTQTQAVKAALKRVEEEILEDHVHHCVEHAIETGDRAQQREKVNEVLAVIRRRSG